MVGCGYGYEYDLVLSICHRVPDVQSHRANVICVTHNYTQPKPI